jgi:hypothetical protein
MRLEVYWLEVAKLNAVIELNLHLLNDKFCALLMRKAFDKREEAIGKNLRSINYSKYN